MDLPEYWEHIPNEALDLLHKNGFSHAVGGYTTRIPGNAYVAMQTAFTCWDKDGNVLCIIYKAPGEEWSLEEYFK